jgi:hypothetical protein
MVYDCNRTFPQIGIRGTLREAITASDHVEMRRLLTRRNYRIRPFHSDDTAIHCEECLYTRDKQQPDKCNKRDHSDNFKETRALPHYSNVKTIDKKLQFEIFNEYKFYYNYLCDQLNASQSHTGRGLAGRGG